jgi:serine/threonine protein kinase
MARIANGDILLGHKIGSGGFGDIYEGYNLASNREPLAVKFESRKKRHQYLPIEAHIYNLLRDCPGFPRLHHYGIEGRGQYNVLATDRLGPSLQDLFEENNRSFSLHTCCMIAIELITRLEMIHRCHFVHRDIKPENFLVCPTAVSDSQHSLFAIDFGLAKRYRDPHSHVHRCYREGRNLTGTPRYASIKTHLGIEQSRRDDLESLGYMLVYLHKGRLPWQGIRGKNRKEKYSAIKQQKLEVKPAHLCEGMPSVFATYLHYCRNLKYNETPDYNSLRSWFADLAKNKGWTLSPREYDWLKSTTTQGREEEGEEEEDTCMDDHEKIRSSHRTNQGTSAYGSVHKSTSSGSQSGSQYSQSNKEERSEDENGEDIDGYHAIESDKINKDDSSRSHQPTYMTRYRTRLLRQKNKDAEDKTATAHTTKRSRRGDKSTHVKGHKKKYVPAVSQDAHSSSFTTFSSTSVVSTTTATVTHSPSNE